MAQSHFFLKQASLGGASFTGYWGQSHREERATLCPVPRATNLKSSAPAAGPHALKHATPPARL
jgi:hypothetical protein